MTEPNYVKQRDVQVGTVLVTDGGFTCMDPDQVVVVREDENGEKFFPCEKGRHYLSGQAEKDHYIGLTEIKKR